MGLHKITHIASGWLPHAYACTLIHYTICHLRQSLQFKDHYRALLSGSIFQWIIELAGHTPIINICTYSIQFIQLLLIQCHTILIVYSIQGPCTAWELTKVMILQLGTYPAGYCNKRLGTTLKFNI